MTRPCFACVRVGGGGPTLESRVFTLSRRFDLLLLARRNACLGYEGGYVHTCPFPVENRDKPQL